MAFFYISYLYICGFRKDHL